VTAKAFAPAIDAILFADAVRYNKFVVARHADVVVAGIAFEAVIAGVRRWNGVSADIA
jgi:hypothetical protein